MLYGHNFLKTMTATFVLTVYIYFFINEISTKYVSYYDQIMNCIMLRYQQVERKSKNFL